MRKVMFYCYFLIALNAAPAFAQYAAGGKTVAESTIQMLYMLPGDKMDAQFSGRGPIGDESVDIERWIVTLVRKNGALSKFEVVISKNTIYGEGESNIATVTVSSLSSHNK